MRCSLYSIPEACPRFSMLGGASAPMRGRWLRLETNVERRRRGLEEAPWDERSVQW